MLKIVLEAVLLEAGLPYRRARQHWTTLPRFGSRTFVQEFFVKTPDSRAPAHFSEK
jgi:hypothetical protein